VRRAAIAAVAGAALIAAAPAGADERIQAQTRDRYGNPDVTIDQGERLMFFNGDLLDDLGVTATAHGPNGRPLFDSGNIGPGQEAVVEGAQFLTPGRYEFYCTIHSFMTGTVTVTGAGAPAPPRADATPAKVGVIVGTGSLDSVLRTGRLPARARADEASTVRLVASTRVSGRTVTLGSATVTLSGAATRSVSIAVGAAARRALARARSVSVSLTGKATDRAGNASAATTRRTLRRTR
jgi:plastocyanin